MNNTTQTNLADFHKEVTSEKNERRGWFKYTQVGV